MKKISFITQVIALTVAIPALSILELKHDHAIQVKNTGSVFTIETVAAGNSNAYVNTVVVSDIKAGV